MSDVISKICSLPRDFNSNHDKSILQILKESGYIGHEDSIAKDDIKGYLISHPDLIEDWEIYSLNKRTSTGWYLVHGDSSWTVGFLNIGGREKEEHFSSEFEACAIFIINELTEIEKNTS